jgi:hypothetical protein
MTQVGKISQTAKPVSPAKALAAKAAEKQAPAQPVVAGLTATGGVTEGKKKLVPIDPKTYTVTKDVKTAGGNAPIDCNDEAAQRFRGLPLEEVYKLTAEKRGLKVEDLKAKYAHLNLGMQRMNLGNLYRAEPKAPKVKAEKTAKEATATK